MKNFEEAEDNIHCSLMNFELSKQLRNINSKILYNFED